MFDFLLKEESLGEDDMRMFTKDRVKKDNHNISELMQMDGYWLQSRGGGCTTWQLQQDCDNMIASARELELGAKSKPR